jgi:hypothetical protein
MIKYFEIRDRATFIPVFAFRARSETSHPAETYLLSRAGYGLFNDSDLVIMGRLEGHGSYYDPYAWNSRTMTTAHNFIMEKFDHLESGAVVDVEFILGETEKPKISERLDFIEQ